MTDARPTLSVVLPSFHGAALLARHVPTLLAHLEQLGVSHEVVVADDGTPDEGATARIAAALGCRYVRNPTNEGKGAAVRRGMLAARGDYRIFTDCDVPYELDAFDRFLHYLDAKEYHFVTGDRTLEASSYYTEIPRLRTLGSHVYSFLVGRFVAGDGSTRSAASRASGRPRPRTSSAWARSRASRSTWSSSTWRSSATTTSSACRSGCGCRKDRACGSCATDSR